MKRYGAPYKGSKNLIAKWVVANLPRCSTLVDAFAGGCAVTHAAMEARLAKSYIVNDIDGAGVDLFLQSVRDVPREWFRWISREEFFRRKCEPHVRLCWSFGNDGKTYIYGRDVEPYKRALWEARVNGDFALWHQFMPGSSEVSRPWLRAHAEEVREAYRGWLGRDADGIARPDVLQRLQSLESLQSLASLESLQSLASLQSLESRKVDYRELAVTDPEAVIYCDPPYGGATGFFDSGGNRIGFDHSAFYDWCERSEPLTVISEYEMPRDRFALVAERAARNRMSASRNSPAAERLYVPINRVDEYYKRLRDE